MNKTTFKLKVLTPMFMGGANPENPELRAASIRGAMRFWFRAIAGAITNNPREVYRLESEVFGNTEKKSKVIVRVKYHQPYKNSSLLIKPEDPTKNKHAKPLPFSLAYLANMGLVKNYGKSELPKDIDKSRRGFYWSRFGFSDKFKFKVEIQSNSERILDIAEKTFKITVYLGGFGTRWRHGFGSCEIIEENNTSLGKLDLETLTDTVKTLTKNLADLTNVRMSNLINNIPNFPIFQPHYVEIWEGSLAGCNNSWLDCLSHIGELYRKFRIKDGDNFRYGHTWDFLNIIGPIFEKRSVKSRNPRNDIFGLPIQFSKTYNINNRKIRKTAIINVEKEQISRRASPLILHVEPENNIVRATLFISEFIPDDAKYFVDRAPNLPLEKPREEDFDRIREFLGPKGLGLTRRHPNVQH